MRDVLGGLYVSCGRGVSRGLRDVLKDVSRTVGDSRSGVMCSLWHPDSRQCMPYGLSLIIYPFLGMYQIIHPLRVISIDSVKINTSLLMMRE